MNTRNLCDPLADARGSGVGLVAVRRIVGRRLKPSLQAEARATRDTWPPLSPQDAHGVLLDLRVGSENRHAMDDGLGDEYPVERVPVKSRKLACLESGFFIDVE